MDVLKDAAESTLTADEQALFDASKPVPTSVTHVVARERTLKDIYAWLVIGGISFVVGIIGFAWWWDTFRHPGTVTVSSTDLAGNALAGGIIGLVLAVGSIWGVMSELRRIYDQNRGVPNRFGLFLTKDAVLVRMDPGSVTRLPRGSITKAEMIEVKKPDGRIDNFGQIAYTGADGKEATVRLSDSLSDQPAHLASAVSAVSNWLTSAG